MSKSREALVTEWIDSDLADQGFIPQTRHQLVRLTLEDDGYQVIAKYILKPPPTPNAEQRIKRSWRAMNLLKEDLSGGNVFLNATRAGLLAKDIITAVGRPEPHTIHVRVLLESLLQSYPSAVISAISAGGKNGMDTHMRPLLSPRTSAQILPAVTHIVLFGCVGKPTKASSERTVMHHQQALQQRVTISAGHRRKFVRSLTEWAFLARLVNIISQEDQNPSIGEDVCETVLTIVECLGYPEKTAAQLTGQQISDEDKPESVGEEQLLAALGRRDWWRPLISKLDGKTSESTKVAAARIIMGIFTLASGRSSRVRKTKSPMTDASEKNLSGDNVESDIDKEAYKDKPHENKLRDWGLTAKIHQALVSHSPQLVHALFRGLYSLSLTQETPATRYLGKGRSQGRLPGVQHPGGCLIVPFTSWRLNVITLFAELFTYTQTDKEENAATAATAARASRLSVMNALMRLPLPPAFEPNGTAPKNAQVFNPWPFFCEWVFDYPENSLYHTQFVRMFKSTCMEHHEATLRLVLQKAKFVSRAIKACRDGSGALKGVLLKCLNILRLRSQSLPPRAFLRQFLHSHDAWKSFREEMKKMTVDQERPTRPVPGEEAVFFKQVGIDLGSRYANQLGFTGMKVFKVQTPAASPAPAPGGKKKKKKRKKKGGIKPEELKETDDDEEYDV